MTDRKNPYKTPARIALVMIFVLLASFFAANIAVYNGIPYQIDVIQSRLGYAATTQNINDKVAIMQEVANMLTPYTENYGWPFPTYKSDPNTIRWNLLSVATDVKEQLGVKERDNYFILPHNELVKYMDTQISQGGLYLDEMGKAYMMNIYKNPSWFILFVMFVAVISTVILAIKSDSWYYN